MTERDIFQPNEVELTDRQVGAETLPVTERDTIVFQLVEAGLKEIDFRYGPNGLRPLAYHNADHTRDVVDASIQLADAGIAQGKITEADKDLLILGGCYHDIEKDFGSGADEAASARVICLQMRDSGQFTDEEVSKVYKMIMGTEVKFEDGVMQQSADPEDLLSMYLADADLATLGKTSQIYWDRAMDYVKETTGSDEPSDDQIVAFALSQDGFLRNHKFYTEEATTLFPYKESNIRYTQQMQRYYASHRS